MFGRIAGVLFFVVNMNVLYMQATPMTELLLLGTMTAGVYELILWHKDETSYRLIKSAFWIMLSTLIRYDGWFLFFVAILSLFTIFINFSGYKTAVSCSN